MLHSFNPLGDRTPRRLSAATRELAARYLSGEIGSTLRPAPQAAGDEPYPVQLRRLAAEAETALSPDERLAGAARWLEATFHRFPGTDRPSVSHVTADFRHAVTGGLAGLEADIAAGRRANPEGAPFYDELAACIGAMRLWVERYRAELAKRLEESPFFPRIAAALTQVPERPPRDFFEAVQSLWLFWTFQRLAGNWSGLGRIDELLGPFLDADLEAGRLDLGEAREILACFWIKGTEWITGRRVAGGDAQFYQNVILAGTGRDGREVCNRVTMLIFDIVEELHISDFPLGVRLSRKSPPPLLRRVAELQSRGGGIVSIYNEEVVIAALVKFGYPEKEACDFTNDGCWETLIPGETAFSYCPFDALQVWQDVFFADCNYPDFESLFAAYSAALRRRLEQVCAGCSGSFNAPDRAAPTPLLSLLIPSCIRSGRPYNRRGAKYNVVALHAGGLPDVANSFTAVRKLIYEDECCTLNELRGILLRDFGGDERLRRMFERCAVWYGNDDEAADAMLARVVSGFAAAAAEFRERDGLLHPAGISTFGREVEFAPSRLATPFGRRAHDYLSGNLAPSPGTDRNGPGAVVKSCCRNDFTQIPNGCPLDLRFDAAALASPSGVAMLEGLLKSFIGLGGYYLQVDAVSREMLVDAKAHPERYPNLAVRISGWSARFATLETAWQDMVIARSIQEAEAG